MILNLFIVLLLISITLIIIAFLKPDESYLGLVGFLFLFLLSFVLLNGNLQYEDGATVVNTFTYDEVGNMLSNSQNITYSLSSFNDSNSHTMGYYLVIISVVGFVGILFSLRSAWKREKERRGGYE